MKYIITIILLLTFSLSQAATRGEVVSLLTDPAFNLLDAENFRLSERDDGSLLYSGESDKNSIIAAVAGPEKKIIEVNVIVSFNNENALMASLFFSSLSGHAFPEREEEAVNWTMQAIAELGDSGGGTRSQTHKGTTVTLKIVPPSIGLYTIKFEK